MLPCYYEQLTNDNGDFLEEEEPANWYQALYSVTTVWELVHNTKSAVFRTEGTKASVGRVNGLQPYGIKNINGKFRAGDTTIGVFNDYVEGIITVENNVIGIYNNYMGVQHINTSVYPYTNIRINTKNVIKEYVDDLVMDNLLVRKWKLVSINGISIKDILNEIKTKQKLLNNILNSQNIKRKGA